MIVSRKNFIGCDIWCPVTDVTLLCPQKTLVSPNFKNPSLTFKVRGPPPLETKLA